MALITKIENQTVFDLLLANAGAISGLFEFLESNDLTDIDLADGSYLAPTVLNADVVSFFRSISSELPVATGGGGIAYGAPSIITLNGSDFLLVYGGASADIELVDQNDDPIVPLEVIGNMVRVDVPIPITSLKGASAMPLKTLQATSYATGDDGGEQRGRPRKTLPILDGVQQLNCFGSKWAMTGKTGGHYDYDTNQFKDVSGVVTTRILAFPDYILVDHSTESGNGDLMWYSLSSSWVGVGSLDFTTAQTTAAALTVAGFSDWFVLNISESKAAFWSLDTSVMPPMEAAYPNTAPVIVLASNTSFSASEIFTHWIGGGNLGTELLYPKTATNPIVTYVFGRIGNTSEL